MYLARSGLKNSTSHINDHEEAKSGQKAGGTIAPYIMIAAVIGIVLVSHVMSLDYDRTVKPQDNFVVESDTG